MEHIILIPLTTSEPQAASLRALQVLFAQACTEIAVTVRDTRCWNRVALHHMVYKSMRERFPSLGSQMVCNAIYSVSRTCRLVLQHPASPFFQGKTAGQLIPVLRFVPSAPVYFDRHTLSLKSGSLSLYTLDGRLRFQVSLTAEQEALFKSEKLNEVSLLEIQGGYRLHFRLGEKLVEEAGKPSKEDALQLPDYILIDQDKDIETMIESSTVQGVVA
ncbi:MAG: hypothetical protein RIR18_2238 [Pseudomonadota bacterium]